MSEKVALMEQEQSTSYAYDELGRISSIGGVGYTHDIRGRLLKIMASGMYNQEMKYSNTGNIVSTTHSAPQFQTGYVYNHYEYDILGRLSHVTRNNTNPNTGINHSAQYDMGYDIAGNITSMSRKKNGTAHKESKQTYYYSGNTLTQVVRQSSDSEFQAGTFRFLYDTNGNMVYNAEKQMQFRYNFLNLLLGMASQDRKFHYIWLADGTKVLDSETGINYKAYLGSLIYEYGTSQSKFKTEFENGTISFDEMTGQHEVLRYFKDHLGSVRVIMQNGCPAAFNEYEPFGRFEQEYSYNKFQNVILPASKNKFMFNGKEEFYNNAKPILNFGARMYDPTIARWNSVDPLAFLFQNHSPYNYCFNSPINYVDPSGMNPQEDEIEILTEIEHIIVTADRIRPSVSRPVSMLSLPRKVTINRTIYKIAHLGIGGSGNDKEPEDQDYPHYNWSNYKTPQEQAQAIIDMLINTQNWDYVDVRKYFDNFPSMGNGVVFRNVTVVINGKPITIRHMDIAIWNEIILARYPFSPTVNDLTIRRYRLYNYDRPYKNHGAMGISMNLRNRDDAIAIDILESILYPPQQ